MLFIKHGMLKCYKKTKVKNQPFSLLLIQSFSKPEEKKEKKRCVDFHFND